MTAAQIAAMAAMTDAEMLAIAYAEAADGDLHRALRDAAEDLLVLEARAEAAAARVSFGYVRGAAPSERR